MTHHAAPHAQQADRRTVIRNLAEGLWFPCLFFAGFLFCYMLAFHQPAPRDVKIAVANPVAASQIGTALDRTASGAFSIQPAATPAAARQAVLDRDATAAYVADPARPVLYVAKADGYTLENVVEQAFTKVAATSVPGHTLTVTDLAPTATGDELGTGLFYLVLALSIPSYVIIMMLLRINLSRRVKIATLVGWGAAVTLIGYAVAVAANVIPDKPLALPVMFLLTQAVALTSFGVVPFAKRFAPGVAVLVFVLLSMPSSGGAIPVQMMASFWRELHQILPMGNLLDALRGIFYFDGVGVAWPVVRLAAWALFGAALIAAHSLWLRRHAVESDGAEEPPVEDPSIEMPVPTALPVHAHHFGELVPTLIGTVSDGDGEGVAHAAVTVIDLHGRQLVHTVTDHAGRYALTGLPEMPVDVVITAPTMLPTVRQVWVRDGATTHHDVTLTPRRTPEVILS